ncbi:troponin T, skeletal muscle [Trichonephila inaurata madagascariensis]|uniref:Troponin T, skeletal muscle n=1 Tax=Trichonephila inaurata madagascariensis TaxID=2747483 RepID=A0A8X7BUZ7_9ARAC|nr:troponin T, skeletal muscle [Trichonephila inaurata madagascariensis]
MADDEREYSESEEEEEEEVGRKKASSGQKATREESQPKMTEAELAMEEKLRKKKEEDEAMWAEYIEQWRKQRSKEEEELRKLKERQARRKVTRAEQEKRMMELKRRQEEQRQREIEEKKQKEAEAKRKRLEDAEKKRQAMLEEQKKMKEGVKPNFVIQKKEGGAPIMTAHAGGFDKMSTVEQARAEMSKSKEQLAEDKQIALTYRVKPLNIEGLGSEKLRSTAEELWAKIVTLESEKYDLEDKMKRQDYDLRELTERQKQINRQKALKKGIDPAEAEGKHPPKIQVASKYERRLDRRTFAIKKSWFEEPKIHVASKFERRVDRRTYVDKKSLFDGGLEKTVKEQMEKSWAERMNTFKERGPKQLPKWDPTAPKVKEVIEHRTYDDDDLLDLEPPSFEYNLISWSILANRRE